MAQWQAIPFVLFFSFEWSCWGDMLALQFTFEEEWHPIKESKEEKEEEEKEEGGKEEEEDGRR